ncbi:MAG: hypothetical protein ABSA16_13375 [Thermoguttaceae bacterium]|jgi:hypothetical protein
MGIPDIVTIFYRTKQLLTRHPAISGYIPPKYLFSHLLMFAWIMTRQVKLFAPFSGRPLDGLGSFAMQTSIGILGVGKSRCKFKTVKHKITVSTVKIVC